MKKDDTLAPPAVGWAAIVFFDIAQMIDKARSADPALEPLENVFQGECVLQGLTHRALPDGLWSSPCGSVRTERGQLARLEKRYASLCEPYPAAEGLRAHRTLFLRFLLRHSSHFLRVHGCINRRAE